MGHHYLSTNTSLSSYLKKKNYNLPVGHCCKERVIHKLNRKIDVNLQLFTNMIQVHERSDGECVATHNFLLSQSYAIPECAKVQPNVWSSILIHKISSGSHGVH
jgi:hypothetical protein